MVEGDKYSRNRQKVYDLLKENGYTDKELGGNADSLFSDRNNASLAYQALSRGGYSSLANDENDFMSLLYGPDGEKPQDNGIGQDGQKSGFARLRSAFQRTTASPVEDEARQDGGDDGSVGQKPKRALGPRLQSVFRKFGERLDEEVDLEAEPVKAQDAAGEIEELEKQLAEIRGDEDFVKQYDDRKSAVSQQAKSFGNLRGDVRGTAIETEFEKFNADRSWLEENAERYEGAKADKAKADEIRGRIAEITRAEEKRKVEEARRAVQEKRNPQDIIALGIRPNGRDNAGRVHDDYAHFGAADDLLGMAEQEYNRGSKYDSGYGGGTADKVGTAIGQFVKGGINAVDKGTLTMGLSEAAAFKDVRRVAEKNNDLINGVFKGLGYDDAAARKVISEAEDAWEKLQPVNEELKPMVAELKDMEATLEALAKSGNEEKYRATYDKYKKKYEEYSKLYKEKYEPLQQSVDKYTDLMDAVQSATEDGLSEGEKAVLDAFGKYVSAKAWGDSNASVASRSGEGLEQTLEFMLDFILTRGVGKAGTKAATKMMANGTLKKYLGETGAKIASKGLADIGVSTVRTSLMFPRSLAAYGEQITQMNRKGSGVDEFGRYKFDRSKANAAVNTALTQFVEYWSEGFGEYFSAGERALFRKVTKNAPKVAIGQTLKNYRGSIGKYLDYGKFDGHFNEMLEEVVGSGLNALAGWMSGDRIGDKEAMKEFWGGENLAVLNLSFLPLSVIGVATNMKAYHRMKANYDRGVATLNPLLENGSLDRKELEDLTSRMPEMTPEQIRDRIVEITDIARKKNGGSLPDDFAPGLMGVLEGNFAMNMQHDAWRDAAENIAVANAYAAYYEDPDAAGSKAWGLARNEQAARDAALEAGFTEEDLDKDSAVLARESGSMKEEDPDRASVLYDYAYAKAQSDGLRDGYDNASEEYFSEIESAIRNSEVDGNVIRATDAEGNVVFITSQDATVDSQGLNTPTGKSGLVSYLTPDGKLAQAKADSFTDATSTPTGEYVAAQRQNFMNARDEWFNIVRESISPEGMVAEIADHVGRTVYVDANGTLAPVRIERTLDNGGTAVISGDKKVLGGIARAAGFQAPEGKMIKVPASQLYSLLAREDDNSLMTDIPSAEENAAVAPAAEPAQAEAAPEMDVQDLRGSYQNIRDIDGRDREVLVTDVRDNGDVVYEYEDENGRTKQNVLPGADFVGALQENQAPATEAPVAPVSTQASAARHEAVSQSDFRGNPIPMKDGQVDQESFRESDPEAWARWVESLPEGDERRPSLGTAKRLEGIAKSAKKAVEKAQKELEKLYDEGASDEKIQAKEKELRGLIARQRLYDDAVRNFSQPAAEAPVAPVVEETPAPAPDVEESNVSGENFEQDITQPEKTPNHPARLREAYESGVPVRIAEAERAITEFINASEDIDAVNATAKQAKARRKKAEKGSAEYKTQDLVAKTAMARLKQLREAGKKTFEERRDAAMEVYFNLSSASEEQLRDALAYFESQSQYEADRGRAEEVRQTLEKRSRVSGQLAETQKEVLASIEGKSPEQVAAEHEAERQKPLKERVKEWEERTGATVEVLESRDQVTNKSAQKAIEGGQNPTGWFDPRTGKIAIYLPNIKDASEIDKTYMHEVVAHKGVRGLLGEDGFNELMDHVWNDLMSEEDKTKWLKYNSHLEGSDEYLRRAAADEFMAHLAEDVDSGKIDPQKAEIIWTKIASKIQEILNKLGLQLKLTEEDLKEVIKASLANLERTNAKIKAQAQTGHADTNPLTEAQKKVIAFVEGKAPEQVDRKAKATEPKIGQSANADKKIDDFGQKIGGARKDQARERIKDSTKLTVKDLSELKDPDKILSRKQIAKYVAEGQMTSADAQTLLATNMAVRSSSGFESYKSLLLVKYRDMASAWERGEDIGFEFTQEDEDFILSQYSERIQQMPTIRESIRKSLAYHAQCFEDYRRTYEALDYPNTARDIKSAYISQGRVDGRFWVKGSYSASRGYPFSTFDEAVVKMKSLYPEKVNVDKEAKKAKDSGDSKTGHLKVVKDELGYFRVKSNLIPGQIFLSRKFYNRKDAEAYLNDNAEALVEKENKMAYALMGSNIGMVQREGQDYRGGKDVTEKDFMETFNPKGVEFGNWVPQAERQEYLNKTYDAIMDFCRVVGISPKAFFLGGRLGIGFGSRGKGGALAHYEYLKEVINLTRMKGAGSLAHEWFHALDNYLAKQKTGNTSDMATDTRNVVRQEVADAFTDFVKAMNALDYSKRSHRAGAYWGEVWERAARLFADYTYNELGGKGIVSPLLARMPGEVDETQEDFILSAWPYATKQENATMKPYFDRLFAAIQEEEGTGVLFRKDGDVKQQQLDIINASNPMTDDYHTGIRSVDDIKTWDEAVAQARQEAEQGGWTELAAYQDITNEMVNEAQESGRITVYSSYPIENGVFVTPSRMQAKDYAGEGEVYSKNIPVTNVAWINTDEGQYAETDKERDDAAEDTRFRKANQTQNGFISNAEMALDKIKMEKATPEQWLKMLEKEGGLKAGEDKWIGLSDWLKESDKKTLTKDEIGDFIEQNRIQIEEEHYGEADITELQREFDEIYDGIIDGIGTEDEDEVIMSPRERAWEELNSRYHGGDDFNSAFYLDDRMRIQVDNEDAAGFFLGKKPINYTRLNYTTEGLTNKQEIALTVPTIDPWNESDEIHFGDAGGGRAVAWIRFGDATDAEGSKVLTIDEIQSKRHQEGREKGYKDADSPRRSADIRKRMLDAQKEANEKSAAHFNFLKSIYGDGYEEGGVPKELVQARPLTEEEQETETRLAYEAYEARQRHREVQEEANRFADENRGKVEAAPFEKNWHELAMKRMLRYAAENGYDKVAWTTGDQQAARYDIGQVVESIGYEDPQTHWIEKDKSRQFVIRKQDGGKIPGRVFVEGEYKGIVQETMENSFGGKPLTDVLGKALANQIIEAEGRGEIAGEGLRIGAEGMKGFYDDILPRFMNKYGKKWGVKVQDINLPGIGDAGTGLTMHSVDVTPEMKESVMEGQVMFRKATTNTEDGETISYESMGGLPEGTKRTSLVERTYRKTGAFSFTGKEKIESAADVAYIFKELETEAVENSFIVFVKDGKPTILHTGIGTINQTEIDSAPMVAGLKDFTPDKIFMVHNHPSGRVEASTADGRELDRLQMMAGDIPVEGIIIDTVSGEYGVFDKELGSTLIDTRRGEEADAVPLEVLTFNKMVFSPDYHSEIGRGITNAEDVAAYLSAHRLGEGEKLGALLLNQHNQVVGNLVFNENTLNAENAETLANDAVEAAVRSAANRVILFGDMSADKSTIWNFKNSVDRIGGGNVRWLDAVKVEGNHTRSLAEGTEEDRITYAEREATGETLGRMGDGLGVKIRRIGSGSMPAGHKTDKGYYDPSTGEMTVCTDNVTDERDAIATVLHETVGYKGLEDLFGDRFREAMANIYATLDRKGRAWVNGYINQNSLDFGSEGVTRGVMEYVSNLADSGNYNDPVWDRIGGILGRVVDANFGTDGFTFTNREMDYVIRAATEHMKNPDWLNTPTGRALDTLMKRQLGINETDPNRPTDPDGPETGILFRNGDTGVANEDYNAEMELWHNVAVMENQNADLPVKIGMEKVMKEVGMVTLAEEDDYLTRHNVASSRAETEAHNFELFYFTPLLEQVRAIQAKLLGKSSNKSERKRAYERILDYLYAVSALERNAYKNTDLDSSEQRDWSGITSLMGRLPEEWQEAEDDAREMIDSFRSEVDDDAELDALWDRIRACTDFSLEHAYKHGLITREEYETLHGTASKPRMWNYYLPLRGFDEKTAEETFNYTSFFGTSSQNPVVKKMKGRWTKADNPLANILNIAENEIVQGNDNWAKQALYSFTLNAGENTLLTEATPWFVKDPATKKWMLAEPAEGQTLEDFEKNMQETFNDEHANGLPHTVKKGRRGLSLDKIMVNKANQNEHLIRLKVAGVDKMIWVNGNPALAKAVNGFRRSQSMQWLRRASRALSNLFTTYSLDFTAKNLIRDTIYSRSAMIVKEDRAYRHRFRKNWWSNFGYGAFAFPMAKLAFAWESGALQSKPAADRTKREQMFIDFMTDGGQTGYTIINSVNEIKRSLERSMRRAAQETGQVTIPVLGHYAKFVKTLNEAFELLTRFTAYETSRDMGRSGLRSAEDAKEISVNFNRRGAQSGEGIWGNIASFLGATHYFYNAGIQGFDNYLRLYKTNWKKMTAITSGLAMMGILTPLINSMLAGAAAGAGDGDDEWYWNLPEWVRRNNIVIGWKDKDKVDEDGNVVKSHGASYFCIPLPVEFRAPYGIGDIAAQAFCYGLKIKGRKPFNRIPNRNGWRVAGDILATASAMLPVNPIEGYTSNGNFGDAAIRAVVPDAMVFFVDWATNRDYTGRALWKENPFNDTAPKSQGAYASTPKGIVLACQKLAEVTEARIDVPPGLVRDFMNNYGGGFFRAAEDVSKIVTGIIGSDPERPLRYDNMPFFSGFSGHLDEDRSDTFAKNALNEYGDLSEGNVKALNAICGTNKLTSAKIYGDEDIPEEYQAKVNAWKTLHPKEFELGRMYLEGMNNKYKMKQYDKGEKKGQWHKSKELERKGVTALKKEWKDLREIWAKMPSKTPEEKSAKAKMELKVQDAWHRYYDAEANLAEALMDYEYGR